MAPLSLPLSIFLLLGLPTNPMTARAFQPKKYSITEIEPNQKFLVTHLGLTHQSGSTLTLFASIDVHFVCDLHENLNQHHHSISQFCARATVSLPKSSLVAHCKQSMPTINATMRNADKNFEILAPMVNCSDLTSPTTHPRTRRGYLDGLGTMFYHLIGTLDAEKEKEYDSIIANLKSNQTYLLEQTKSQVTLIDNLIQRQINHNKELNGYLNDTIHAMRANMNHTLNLMAETDEYHYLIPTFTLALEQHDTVINSIITATTLANRGILHLSLIETATFLSTLRHLEKNLPNSLKLPLPPTLLNYNQLWSLLQTRYYVSGGQLNFIIQLPLYEVNTISLLKITMIPHLVHAPHTFAQLLEKPDVYLVDNQTMTFTTLSPTAFSTQCRPLIKDIFHCASLEMSQRDPVHSSCALSQVYEIPNPTACITTVINVTQPLLIRLPQPNTWIALIPSDIPPIDVFCPPATFIPIKTLLKSQQILTTAPPCHIRTSNRSWHPTEYQAQITMPQPTVVSFNFSAPDYAPYLEGVPAPKYLTDHEDPIYQYAIDLEVIKRNHPRPIEGYLFNRRSTHLVLLTVSGLVVPIVLYLLRKTLFRILLTKGFSCARAFCSTPQSTVTGMDTHDMELEPVTSSRAGKSKPGKVSHGIFKTELTPQYPSSDSSSH